MFVQNVYTGGYSRIDNIYETLFKLSRYANILYRKYFLHNTFYTNIDMSKTCDLLGLTKNITLRKKLFEKIIFELVENDLIYIDVSKNIINKNQITYRAKKVLHR